MIELNIDNRAVTAAPGETVLQAALRNGIEIPHFCYHDCLSIAANCRVCLVKVDNRPKLLPSCNLQVAPGMEVVTDSDEVIAARQAVMQFITLNHPGDCGICDKAGECKVQDYFVKYGECEATTNEQKLRKPKLLPLGPRILLDNERCILCSRCVRFTREISGSHMLGIVGRGSHARVAKLDSVPFDDPYSDNLVALCPSGALLSRDFLYKSRVWYLEPVRSVCTGCARCCSINVWRRKKHWHVRSLGEEINRMAYRVTPCTNPEINGPWICNKGYDLHKTTKRQRALVPLIGGKKSTVENVLVEVAQLLTDAANPAALISTHASNEELAAFKEAFGSRMRVYTRQDHLPGLDEPLEDDFLIRADKNPNGRGVRELFGDRPYDSSAGHDLVLVWGEMDDYPPLGNARVIHLTPYAPRQTRTADLLIPISTTLERSGSFTNFEGKRNRFEAAFDKPKMVQHAEELFGRLKE